MYYIFTQLFRSIPLWFCFYYKIFVFNLLLFVLIKVITYGVSTWRWLINSSWFCIIYIYVFIICPVISSCFFKNRNVKNFRFCAMFFFLLFISTELKSLLSYQDILLFSFPIYITGKVLVRCFLRKFQLIVVCHQFIRTYFQEKISWNTWHIQN